MCRGDQDGWDEHDTHIDLLHDQRSARWSARLRHWLWLALLLVGTSLVLSTIANGALSLFETCAPSWRTLIVITLANACVIGALMATSAYLTRTRAREEDYLVL
jgi:hypothetical protein